MSFIHVTDPYDAAKRGAAMTPDDVVARAKELEGREVHITVRGVVTEFAGDNWGVARPSGHFTVQLTSRGVADSDIVDIRPAPLRIEPGALYRSGSGELLRGDDQGGLQGFDGGYIGADEITADSELVRVRVVEA